MFFRIALSFACMLCFAACGEPSPTDAPLAEASGHLGDSCNAPLDPAALAAVADWARDHIDVPLEVEEGVIFVPDDFLVDLSPDGREMTTLARRGAYRPTVSEDTDRQWYCTCEEAESNCRWVVRHGTATCKGACGESSCKIVREDIPKVEPAHGW